MLNNIFIESIHNYFLERKNNEQRLQIIQILQNFESYIIDTSNLSVINIEQIIYNNGQSFDAESFEYLYRLFYDLEIQNIPLDYLVSAFKQLENQAHNPEFKNYLKIARKRFATFPRKNPNIEVDHSYIKDEGIKVLNYLGEESLIISLLAINGA